MSTPLPGFFDHKRVPRSYKDEKYKCLPANKGGCGRAFANYKVRHKGEKTILHCPWCNKVLGTR